MSDTPLLSSAQFVPAGSQTPRAAMRVSAAAESYSSASTTPLSDSWTKPDSASISAKAREAWLVEQNLAKPSPTANPWESLFGYREGTRVLKGGNRQVTSFQGSDVLVLEYDGDRLVRRESGTIAGGVAVVDVERYDEAGRLARATHSELRGLEDGGLSSEATLTRTVSWYDGDQLTRHYTDSLTLDASYSATTLFEPEGVDEDDLSALAGALTHDNIGAVYSAQLSQYEDGQLVASLAAQQSTSYELVTNRALEKQSGLPGHSTEMHAAQNAYSVSMANYGPDGALLREAAFSEAVDRLGQKVQNVEETWYAGGKVVRKDAGRFQGSLPEGGGLNTQLLLDTLDMTQGGYSTTVPSTASQLLGADFRQTADTPGFYTADAQGNNGQGSFSSLRNLQNYENVSDPYSYSWSTELYADGTLAARTEDTLEAEVNRNARDIFFATGAGLTEDESPAMLLESSHATERYDENGRLAARASRKSAEHVAKDDRGVYHLFTHTRSVLEDAGQDATADRTEEGRLAGLDPEMSDAAQGVRTAADRVLGDARKLLGMLQEPEGD